MRNSRQFTRSVRWAGWLTLLLLALLIIFLLTKSWPFIRDVGISGLWQHAVWAPSTGEYNMLPMLVGSLLLALGAVFLAAPVAVLLAIFIHYYAPEFIARLLRSLVELLAGIPSVVYGFWGLLVLVPMINQWVSPGTSLLAGILVLALMILPLAVVAADSAFEKIPALWLSAASALALRRWSTIRQLVLPAAMPGILSGIVLQTGRALGETMAVLMVCGNIVQIPKNVFEPVRTLTANIALEMAYATDQHSEALFVSGLLLLVVTIVLVCAAHHLSARRQCVRGSE